MIKDRAYLKNIQSKDVQQAIEFAKSFLETVKTQDELRETVEVVQQYINELEFDVVYIPKLHRIAVIADSCEALYYYESLVAGRDWTTTAEVINIYCRFHNAEHLKTQDIYYRTSTHGMTCDVPRKKLDKVIKAYCEGQKQREHDRGITDHRLKQIPFIRALIDLYIEQGRYQEAGELMDELDYLRTFIRCIDEPMIQELMICRYEKRESWSYISCKCLRQGCRADEARKKVERYLMRYNEQRYKKVSW